MKKFRWGSHASICDVCGERYRSEELKRRWDGAMVCHHDFETRHSLDFQKIPRPEGAPSWTFNYNDLGDGCLYSGAIAGLAVAGCAIAGTGQGSIPSGTFTMELD